MSSLEPQLQSLPDTLSVDWGHCLDHLQTLFTPQQFITWIEPLQCNGLISHEKPVVLRLTAPNRFKQNWARENLVTPLTAWLAHQLSAPVHIDIAVQNDDAIGVLSRAQNEADTHADPTTESITRSANKTLTPLSAPVPHDSPDQNHARLNDAWTFDSFVPGKANQLARAAALQVADNPGSGYNPLFLYGGVGLGKSHLIHAIGNSLRQRLPQAKIRYIHGYPESRLD